LIHETEEERIMKRISILTVSLLASSIAVAPIAKATTYVGTLSGANESPATSSLGSGSVVITVSPDLATMEIQATFMDLSGTSTAAHIHCCLVPQGPLNVNVATQLPSFTGFPLGVTSGSYDHTFDLTDSATYNPAFVTAQGSVANAQAALLAGIAGGTAYFNIHSTAFTGGEIRTFFTVPEPRALGWLVLGLGALGLALRRRLA
jgi:hypothetical protein